MLIRFNVKNFLSFDKQADGKSEEFTMVAGKVRSKEERLYKDENIKLLKFTALYGANASGKSNFIKALNFMQETVVTGKLPVRYSNFYCKTAEDNKNKESYFEIQLLINNKYYLYGFTVLLSTGEFLSEWLYEVSKDREIRIFERDIANGIFDINPIQDKSLAVKFDVYTDDIKKNSGQLFLYFMNDNKDNLYKDFKDDYQVVVFKNVYEWFAKVLDINYPDRPISASLYLTDEKKLKLASELLKAFDTGINELQLVDVHIDNIKGDNIPQDVIEKLVSEMEADFKEIKNKKKVKQVRIVLRSKKDYYIFSGTSADDIKCQSLKFRHNNISSLFDLIEESDGTIRI
ncbi:MAG: AAA family ATPase, partial [Mucispirillum sp.]|nr:AAA family ATPase [Mucispirillum sp.]